MNKAQEYWRTNLKLVVGCLIVWFIVSFGAGILFHDVLNNIRIGGYKLGFWFAQQGSMYVFIALIFFYSIRMNKIDHKFGVEEEEDD
jgi:putative solute:sodium symporter small subunit